MRWYHTRTIFLANLIRQFSKIVCRHEFEYVTPLIFNMCTHFFLAQAFSLCWDFVAQIESKISLRWINCGLKKAKCVGCGDLHGARIRGVRRNTRGINVRGAEFYAGRGEGFVLGKLLDACRGDLRGSHVRRARTSCG